MKRIIAVTGASGALGSAVVDLLIGQGHMVVAINRSSRATRAVTTIDGFDLAHEADAANAFARVAEEVPRLDGLVNCAGGFRWELVNGGSAATWDALYNANLRSTANACRAAIPLLAVKGGAIVNVGAASAASPGVGMAAYAASKAGVASLTQSLAAELAGQSIRVNAVLPLILDTPANRADMPDVPHEEWMSVDDAAQVIAFLLDEASLAVSGALIPLTGARRARRDG